MSLYSKEYKMVIFKFERSFNIKAYLWKTWYKFWSPFMHIGADQRSESQVEAEDKALHHQAMKEAWSADAHG